MANLSERELLLLNSIMYIDGSTDKISLKEIIKKSEYKMKQGTAAKYLSGSITPQEALEIIEEAKNNKNLMNLKAVASIDGNVRATCFVDMRNSEAVVVIRGTGGIPGAWLDNLKAIYLTETKMQKQIATDFFDKIKDVYNITCVSGHSKGGNLAQYLTIIYHDYIKRCVSFDGQGFPKKFIKLHETAITLIKDKITSISSYKDPVNGLLNPVAGKMLYINTKLKQSSGRLKIFKYDFSEIGAAHKSTKLLEKDFFNTEGNFSVSAITKKDQIVDKINKNLNRLENYPTIIKRPLGNISGTILATLMSISKQGRIKSFGYLLISTIYGLAALPRVIAEETIGRLAKKIFARFKTNSKNNALQKDTKTHDLSQVIEKDKLRTDNAEFKRENESLGLDEYFQEKESALEKLLPEKYKNESTIKETLAEMKQKLDERNKFIQTIESNINKVENYKDIAHPLENKVFFKGAYNDKNNYELKQYNKSKDLLAKIGINSREELLVLKENYNKLNNIYINLDKKRRLSSEDRSIVTKENISKSDKIPNHKRYQKNDSPEKS